LSGNDFRTMLIVPARPASPAGFLFSADVCGTSELSLRGIPEWASISAQDDDK
jgi:hypothetical protein